MRSPLFAVVIVNPETNTEMVLRFHETARAARKHAAWAATKWQTRITHGVGGPEVSR